MNTTKMTPYDEIFKDAIFEYKEATRIFRAPMDFNWSAANALRNAIDKIVSQHRGVSIEEARSNPQYEKEKKFLFTELGKYFDFHFGVFIREKRNEVLEAYFEQF